MNKAASVKARLLNFAEKEKRSYQEVLQTYGLERVIYRLAKSKFVMKFTLKGGILLYALFDGKYPRSTTDIDLLGMEINRDQDSLQLVFKEVLSVDLDDGIVFDTASLRAGDIAQTKDYPGIRITVMALLERTKIPITIDIGFGDSVIPEPINLPFPALLDASSTSIKAYSLESVIAEKFEAIAALGFLNSRYKDFFDICMLSRSFTFDGKQLEQAISSTFNKRHTSLKEITAFEENFAADDVHLRRWGAFIKKKAPFSTLTLADVIKEIRRFILPVLTELGNEIPYDKMWDPSAANWK